MITFLTEVFKMMVVFGLQAGIEQIQILIAVFGILGSGVAAYVGVKVAVAEMRKDIANLYAEAADLDKRVDRLERPYFERRS